jgi:SAM-dependent methyltransferase
MGIDIHAVNFLKYASQKKPLGNVATIGRQHLMIPRDYVKFGQHCEALLQERFGAQRVDSYDFSDYEGATHIVDMNLPLVPEKQYDTIIDCGCTEHIFNVAQALRNISQLCISGGQIIHVLPANNFCGHGFWQFSPELFFSLYSRANGYNETEVFLADLRHPGHWFEVKQPENGQRANVVSNSPLYALCRTAKVCDVPSQNVQQSDYVHTWEKGSQAEPNRGPIAERAKKVIKKNPLVFSSTLAAYGRTQASIRGFLNPVKLSNRNRHLKRRAVAELLAG